MNRRGLKEASRQCLRDADYSPKTVTLVFLLAVLALNVLEWGVTLLSDGLPAGGHYLSDMVSSLWHSTLVQVLASLICQLALVLLSVGYSAFSLRVSRGEGYRLNVLLTGFHFWGKTLLLYVLVQLQLTLLASLFALPVTYVLTALAMSSSFAGALTDEVYSLLLLCAIAVIMLVLSYRYRMCWYVLLDNPELSTRQIIRQTTAINKVHRTKIFLLDLSFVPWLLLSVLTCGILLIWKLPYIMATYAHAYNYMLEDYTERQQRLQELISRQNGPDL